MIPAVMPRLPPLKVALALPVVLVALLAGLGWLYVLRGLGWLGFGPRVHDALPLLQLAGFDVQPAARIVVAWSASGLLLALPLAWIPRAWRATLVAALALALLLVAAQASFALARNLNFGTVLWSRRPGAGPWLEGLVLAAGCAVGDLALRRRQQRQT